VKTRSDGSAAPIAPAFSLGSRTAAHRAPPSPSCSTAAARRCHRNGIKMEVRETSGYKARGTNLRVKEDQPEL